MHANSMHAEVIHIVASEARMSPKNGNAESHLPLKPAEFLVLLVLSAEDLHGYGIKKEVAQRSGGRIDMEPGTLYRLMARLVSAGLIAEADRRPVPDQDDERRRYYRITDVGRRAVSLEAERLVQLTNAEDVRSLARGV